MSTLNRRQFSKLLGLGAASLGVSPLHARSDVPTMYYVDGYHGGAKGHMPAGAWRDVLNVMRAVPEWKISLEIEPVSWAVLDRISSGGKNGPTCAWAMRSPSGASLTNRS
ncbi:MAG: hypothetical protein WD423_05450 [Rhodothermales bacterium]